MVGNQRMEYSLPNSEIIPIKIAESASERSSEIASHPFESGPTSQ